MYLIGLTGNIASGKSTVALMLAEHGAQVIDADELSHAVLLRGRPAWHAVLREFGPGILRSNGQVDRRKLGREVFGKPDKLRQLEGIIHPAVRLELTYAIRRARDGVLVIEAVKLVEGGLNGICDSVWVVVCGSEETKRRLILDRRMTPAEADARLASQPTITDKLRIADVVIDNAGSLGNTRAQVDQAWAHIPLTERRDKSVILAQLLGLSTTDPSSHLSAREAPSESAVTIGPTTNLMVESSGEIQRPSVPSPIGAPSTAEAFPGAVKPVVAQQATSLDTIVLPGPTITVHRATRGDLDILSEMLARQEGMGTPLDQVETMQRLGKWGYWLVSVDDRPRGLIGWRAENLVGLIRDCWFESEIESATLLSPLLQGIENEARSLVNEVLIFVLDPQTANAFAPIARAHGYSQQKLDDLHKIWREVVKEHIMENDQIYVKRLREEMVTRPI